jgi:undecaprenyl-diphosphatase
VGIFQAIAIIPGVSRSGATILGGLLLGIKRIAIVEFSFLLAVPTIGAATLYDLYKSTPSFAPGDFTLLGVGFVVSFVVALLSIKFLLSYIRYHTFIAFGAYRIALALIFWLVII